MQARDVMTTRVITVGPDTDIAETAKRLLENRISAVPVVEPDGRIVGIVSEGDLMRRSESGTERRPSWWLSLLLLPEQKAINYVKTHGRCARDVMTREVITVNEGATLDQIAETLEKHRIKRVPVVRDGKLVGIVSRANLLHGLVASQTGASPSMDDRKIKATVEKNLADAGVRAQLLNIVVSGGVVHVWGVVVTPQEQAAVQVAAENAPGAGCGGKRTGCERGPCQRRCPSVLHAPLRASRLTLFCHQTRRQARSTSDTSYERIDFSADE